MEQPHALPQFGFGITHGLRERTDPVTVADEAHLAEELFELAFRELVSAELLDGLTRHLSERLVVQVVQRSPHHPQLRRQMRLR